MAKNVGPMSRRRPTIPRQATSREAPLPSHPRPSNAAADVGRPLRVAIQTTALASMVLHILVAPAVGSLPWPIRP